MDSEMDIKKLLTLLLFFVIALPAVAENLPTLVIIGDSISEGYGVSKEESYPELLAKKLASRVVIKNASISGSTTASAESRIKWQLKQKPDFIFIALGANDGLRGLPAQAMEKNLASAARLSQAQGVKVWIAAMKLPMNYGKEYRAQFERAFRDAAKKSGAHLIPFILESVGGKKQLNQADGIHPNAAGHQIIADQLEPEILRLIEERKKP